MFRRAAVPWPPSAPSWRGWRRWRRRRAGASRLWCPGWTHSCASRSVTIMSSCLGNWGWKQKLGYDYRPFWNNLFVLLSPCLSPIYIIHICTTSPSSHPRPPGSSGAGSTPAATVTTSPSTLRTSFLSSRCERPTGVTTAEINMKTALWV